MNSRLYSLIATGTLALFVSGCTSILPQGNKPEAPIGFSSPFPTVSDQSPEISSMVTIFDNSEKECLVRAMYFESNRSSEAGMMAVGTVVMNRVDSAKFDNSICAVVGAPRQFAPGVLSREMTEKRPVELASSVADRILAGERHPGVRSAMFFHQAGLVFPYNNMKYVLEAGGNAFYIKLTRDNLSS